MVIKLTRQASFKPTDEQAEVIRCVSELKEDLVVEALAGTGKTTTQEQAVRSVPASRAGKRGCLAFNKSIAVELKRRMPSKIWTGTIHSRGRSVLEKHATGLELEKSKYWRMVDEAWKPAPGRMPKELRQSTVALVRAIRECSPFFLEENEAGQDAILKQLAQHFGLPIFANSRTWVSIVLQLGLNAFKKDGVIDFSDMIWIPLEKGMKMDRFDLLMVDESQDLNLSQQEFCLRSSERFVVVGDRHQSIYGFRGADVKAIDRLTETLPNGSHVLPLTVTQRCPVSVVELAKLLVPKFRAREDAKRGEVVTDFFEDHIVRQAKPGDLILCRTNAPLMPMLYSLWKNRVKAKIVGRDEVGQRLVELTRSYMYCDQNMSLFIEKVWAFRTQEMMRLEKDKASAAALVRLDDDCEMLAYLARQCKSTKEILERLEEMFVEEAPNTAIRLSSIHRAKGLEANQVFLLRPELLPHHMASSDWEIQQEYNLAYVAVTRAIETLYICGSLPPAFGV